MTLLDRNHASQQAARTDGRRPGAGLAERVGELVRTMPTENDARAWLDRIVAAAVAEVPGASFAGLTLAIGTELSTEAATDDIIRRLDRVQYDIGQGPCIQSKRTEKTLRSDDLLIEPRWPKFGARAVELGLRSMLSVQLYAQHKNMAVLNLFATEPAAFDDDDETIGLLLGSCAAVAMAASRKQVNLELALDSRDVIGQAKGILMERHKINSQQAFDLIIDASQRAHRKVRDVARDVAESGEFPPPS